MARRMLYAWYKLHCLPTCLLEGRRRSWPTEINTCIEMTGDGNLTIAQREDCTVIAHIVNWAHCTFEHTKKQIERVHKIKF
jgi:hypothetical protein